MTIEEFETTLNVLETWNGCFNQKEDYEKPDSNVCYTYPELDNGMYDTIKEYNKQCYL